VRPASRRRDFSREPNRATTERWATGPERRPGGAP
jgi:hypothetical protein